MSLRRTAARVATLMRPALVEPEAVPETVRVGDFRGLLKRIGG